MKDMMIWRPRWLGVLIISLLLLTSACASMDLERYADTRTRVQADLDDVRLLFKRVGAAYDAAHAARLITNAEYRPWRTFVEKARPEIIRIGSEVSAARVRESLNAVHPDILRMKVDLVALESQLDAVLAGRQAVK